MSLNGSHAVFKTNPPTFRVIQINTILSPTRTVRQYFTMADVAPAPAKALKKKAPRPKKTGPSVGELIVKAISASKERKGVSLAALKKALAAVLEKRGYVGPSNNAQV